MYLHGLSPFLALPVALARRVAGGLWLGRMWYKLGLMAGVEGVRVRETVAKPGGLTAQVAAEFVPFGLQPLQEPARFFPGGFL